MWIVMAVTLLTLLALPLSSVGAPRISLDKETYDYGPVPYGKSVTQEFTVTNTGDQTLSIQQLRSSCGCTVASKAGDSIAPGAKTEILVSFNTAGLRGGRKRQTIFVESNDPERPTVRVTLLAEVMKDLNVDNPSLARNIAASVETVSFQLKIGNSSDKAYTVKGVRSDSGGVRASLNPKRALIEPKSSAMLTLELKLDKEPGRQFYTGGVFLETDHASEKEIEVRYLVKIDSAP
jgi:hypothetical protein